MNADLRHLGPLYHSYRLLGGVNDQLPGIYAVNQACKEPILIAYIEHALAKCRATLATPVSFAELFCADGYYAMVAKHLGATTSTGIDNGRDDFFASAPRIAEALGLEVDFRRMDVEAIDTLPPVDVVANVGGLYHVSDPLAILRKSHAFARRFLIVQTVVSMARDDDAYYEAPAPGWTWGNRFSRASFDKAIRETGWRVVDRHFNELEANERPEDRGSAYYLVSR